MDVLVAHPQSDDSIIPPSSWAVAQTLRGRRLLPPVSVRHGDFPAAVRALRVPGMILPLLKAFLVFPGVSPEALRAVHAVEQLLSVRIHRLPLDFLLPGKQLNDPEDVLPRNNYLIPVYCVRFIKLYEKLADHFLFCHFLFLRIFCSVYFRSGMIIAPSWVRTRPSGRLRPSLPPGQNGHTAVPYSCIP